MRARLAVCLQCDRYRAPCPEAQQLADESAGCPLAKWENALPLGELAHSMLRPLARAADALLGTNLSNCGGCERRRAGWNKIGVKIGTKFLP